MLKNVLYVQFFLVAFAFSACTEDNDVTESAIAEANYMQDYEGPEFKWGFLDKYGDVAITAQFDQVSGFTEGLAAINLEGRWGYIDKSGDIVIRCQYLAAWPFSDGLARVTLFTGKQCFINRKGELSCPKNAVELGDYHEGRMALTTEGGSGYIDGSGNTIVDAILDRASTFRNGYAVVVLQGNYGLIDNSGNYVIPAEYDKLFHPSEGNVCAKEGSQYFYLDLEGQKVHSQTYLSAKPFHDGRATVKSEKGWALIDKVGAELEMASYSTLIYRGAHRWIAKNSQGFALIADTGEPLTDFIYDQINMFNEDLAVYRRDGLCGFMDRDGLEVTPPQYGIAWDFHEGLARAAFRDGIAYVDRTGSVPFLPEYFELRDFSSGLAPFQDE